MGLSKQLLLSFLVVTLISCGPNTATRKISEEESMENVSTIYANCVWGVDGNLDIAAGNFMYVDASGDKQRELVAALWFVLHDGPEPKDKQSFQVHTGQEVIFGQYKVKVVEIGVDDKMGPFVRLALNSN